MISAAYNITNQRDAVNALNVFPVPDGDTGTNMSMTITSARKDPSISEIHGLTMKRTPTAP